MKFRAAYDKHVRHTFETVGDSMTKQSEADSCNVNLIMKKYEKHGILPVAQSAQANYGDFSNCHDYQTSLNAVMEAQDNFMRLPAAIRARFENDPQQFVEFVSNPANLDDCIQMGLAEPKIEFDLPPDDNPVADSGAGGTPADSPSGEA